ncbi:polysaccharide biosynthesis C-terminal domain-containing protein [Microbacterium sp.]|uniref:lipopolysaccharide biosynthesis protein n=1 Tax=Microbacterium sp. TaxID=51671 RepID=UPI0032422966
MKARLLALGRVTGFATATGFVSVISLVTTWFILRAVGSGEWGVLAAIQSAAGLFGVMVAFGWATTGAAEVAALGRAKRGQWYADSLISRIYLCLLAYPVMVLVMASLNRDHVLLVIAGSAAYLLPYLGASWFFVGEASPIRLFTYDILPQAMGLVTSVPVILASNNLILAVSTQFAFNLVGVVISARRILRNSGEPARLNYALRPALARLRGQRHSMTTATTSALYVSTPMLIINALIPGSLAQYGMGDRLFRVALTCFAPIVQFVQGWIPEGGPKNVRHRVIQATRLTPLVSVIGGAAVYALGPWAVSILSSGQIAFGSDLALPFALVFFFVSLSQVWGLACLVPLGQVRILARSTVLGAAVGVPLLIAGALAAGLHGVAWALAVSECVVTVYQFCVILAQLARTKESTQGSASGTA